MPKTTRKQKVDGTLDITTATLPQLVALPAEVLHLHLSARSLVTTEAKPVMAKHVYEALQRPASHFMGLELNSTFLSSCTTPSQANEDIVCQLLQLLALQSVSSASQLLALLSLPSTNSYLRMASSPFPLQAFQLPLLRSFQPPPC